MSAGDDREPDARSWAYRLLERDYFELWLGETPIARVVWIDGHDLSSKMTAIVEGLNRERSPMPGVWAWSQPSTRDRFDLLRSGRTVGEIVWCPTPVDAAELVQRAVDGLNNAALIGPIVTHAPGCGTSRQRMSCPICQPNIHDRDTEAVLP